MSHAARRIATTSRFAPTSLTASGTRSAASWMLRPELVTRGRARTSGTTCAAESDFIRRGAAIRHHAS